MHFDEGENFDLACRNDESKVALIGGRRAQVDHAHAGNVSLSASLLGLVCKTLHTESKYFRVKRLETMCSLPSPQLVRGERTWVLFRRFVRGDCV